ncbi:hypothetical protein L4D09_24655 [Photobacterium makurazakiensis]|uniref:hypothetical protein n=1 Tax=Photobacterium makurazakiensis TaxID=2910234 RepID=UPI003D0ED164
MFSSLLNSIQGINSKSVNSSEATIEEVLKSLPADLKQNEEYFINVIARSIEFLKSETEELTLPTINLNLSKENALPQFMWGLLWDEWEKTPQDGTTIFLQDYAERGENNRKKKAYFSALTPDLFNDAYRDKVSCFFEQLLDKDNIDKPIMSNYQNSYLDLFWSLHLDVMPSDIPDYAKGVGLNFMNCLALVTPLVPLSEDNAIERMHSYYKSYMYVRENRSKLDSWIKPHVDTIVANPDRYTNTFVHYWDINGDKSMAGGHFEKNDIVFECFHNFLALSQWGNVIYNIMDLLREDNNEPQALQIQAYHQELMSGDYNAKDGDFTKLDYFVFELLRVIMPNDGSISRVKYDGKINQFTDTLNIHNHITIGNSPLHWSDTELVDHKDVAPFNPDRYLDVPRSNTIDNDALKQVAGLARCPFDHNKVKLADGRTIENNAYGTTYSSHSAGQCPVVETAGYSPFGFGYRRCPGELFTVDIFKTFLITAWENNIGFKLNEDTTHEPIAVAPATFVPDNITFIVKS